jgi:2-methylisocitrate lyase-like PEP mutase family enzyme
LIESLKQRLVQKPALLAAGAYDALSALLIEQAGFEAVYASGAGIAYTQLGRPDMGLVTFDHLADVVARMRERVTLPLIVDADTGFGNALNVQRTVRVLEQRGANAIQLEDQTFPKRCGHLSNKSVIDAQEMAGKIRAATDARQSSETLIIARTDAIATDGLSAALDRAALFIDSGADVIFVEAPRSLIEMRRIVDTIGSCVPLLANMVEGGVTPILSCDELSTLGYSLVISPAALIRAQAWMTEDFLRSLKAHGTTRPYADRMLDFTELNTRIGIQQLSSAGQRYDASFSVAPAIDV